MERQNLGLGLLVVLLLAGVFPRWSAGAGPAAPVKTPRSESSIPSGVSTPAVSPDVRTVLRRYLDDRDPENRAPLDPLDPRYQVEVESLVAIVPDPIESSFGDV